MLRCQNCLTEIEKDGKCPRCGYVQCEGNENLLTGEVIKDRYFVGKVFSEDSATRVYVAFDNTLGKKVFIREYDGGGMLKAEDEFNFDSETRAQAVARYISYGKSLASIGMCSLFPKTTDIFDYSEKGYIVTDYFEGESLKKLLKAGVKISIGNAKKIAEQLCEGVSVLHRSHMIFGRICPETVYILRDTGEVRLFGIGSPFFDSVKDFDLRVEHINPSYAAPEIYDKNARRGTFTDIYSIAAILYRIVTDEIPPVSFLRLKGDDILVPSKCNREVDRAMSNSILNALNCPTDIRTETPALFVADLAKDKVKRVASLKLRLLGLFGKLGKGHRDSDNKSPKGIIILTVLSIILVAVILFFVLWLDSSDDEKDVSSKQSSSNTASTDDTFYGTEGTSSREYNFESLLGDNSSSAGNTVSVDQFPPCPPAVGKNFEQAKSLLESQGFVVVVKGYEFSAQYAEGNVISQSIPAGTRAKLGSRVELVISKGEEVFYATVPDVTNLELTEAMLKLKEAGFPECELTFEAAGPAGEAVGTVIYQNIKNADIEIGSIMYLTVVGQGVSIPDYKDKSLNDVDFSGLNIEIKDESGNVLDPATLDKSKYTVVSQSLNGGTKGYVGQKMTVTVKEQ